MLTKMKINGFKRILDMAEVDRFQAVTFDTSLLYLTVHENEQDKYFVIHSPFQVYGWTQNAFEAFGVWHNVSIFTCDELYDGLRGK